MFGSDIGHWDVVDVGEVAEGLITQADFKERMFSNPVELHTSMNPRCFKGTRVEQHVAKFLREGRGG